MKRKPPLVTLALKKKWKSCWLFCIFPCSVFNKAFRKIDIYFLQKHVSFQFYSTHFTCWMPDQYSTMACNASQIERGQQWNENSIQGFHDTTSVSMVPTLYSLTCSSTLQNGRHTSGDPLRTIIVSWYAIQSLIRLYPRHIWRDFIQVKMMV